MSLPAPASIYDVSATTITGESVAFAQYRGRVLLVVNVASQCGYTPQYRALEALYRAHRDAGLDVLGFPCNQFGRQEPGTELEIRKFCSSVYHVTFPLFARIDVNGPNAHPLYQFLTSQKRGLFGASIKWNFSKFLVGRRGDVLARFGARDRPEAIEPDIVRALAENEP